MPKLKDLNILHIQDGERIQFRTPVNVTKEGLFTTTLPNEAYNAIVVSPLFEKLIFKD